MGNVYRIFLSFPMHGISVAEQIETRDRLAILAKHYFQYMKKYSNALDKFDSVDVIDNLDASAEEGDGRLYYLGQAVMKLDKANAILFGNGSQDAKGCRIEYAVAKEYGLDIIDNWGCWN